MIAESARLNAGQCNPAEQQDDLFISPPLDPIATTGVSMRPFKDAEDDDMGSCCENKSCTLDALRSRQAGR